MQGEIGSVLQDPSQAVNIAFGPPFPELVPQDPNTGLRLGGQYDKEPRRFVFKKAHLSREDFRIFDQRTGRLVCVSHHWGKNPYESLDPLGVAHNPKVHHGMLGEMESLCHITGYMGMPSFKVRPKAVSIHGRQVAVYPQTGQTMFSMAKVSRIKTLSLRHNLEVCIGDSDDEEYIVEADLMGRTLNIRNKRDETVAFAAKSTKALIMTQVLGAGSEMILDVAPGMDWTAACGIMMVTQQVGAHYIKDLFEMFVAEPLKDYVMDTAVEATGTQGIVNHVTHATHTAQSYAYHGQNMHNQFNHQNQHY
eukprot:jgi/Ulvmu1/466/UM001_0473.1